MRKLNKLGGKHGIGRVDIVENRFVGMKSRGVYETPGGTILHFGHRQMESITMDREVMHIRDSLIPKYSELVYNGFWYAPEREALQALVSETQKTVSGTVRLKLYKGGLYTAGRKSKLSLYNPDIATMEADPTDAYNQDDATGFINLNALRLKVRSKVQGVKTRSEKELTFGGQFHLRVNVGDACRAGGISDSHDFTEWSLFVGLNIQVYLRVCFDAFSQKSAQFRKCHRTVV